MDVSRSFLAQFNFNRAFFEKSLSVALAAFVASSSGCGVDRDTVSNPQGVISNGTLEVVSAQAKFFDGEYVGTQPSGLFDMFRYGGDCKVTVSADLSGYVPMMKVSVKALKKDVGPEGNDYETVTTQARFGNRSYQGMGLQSGKAGEFSFTESVTLTLQNAKTTMKWTALQLDSVKQQRTALMRGVEGNPGATIDCRDLYKVK